MDSKKQILSGNHRPLGWMVKALCLILPFLAITSVDARDGHRHRNESYQYERANRSVYHRGHGPIYRDRNGYNHVYQSRHNHRGYWRNNNGLRVWINLF
ncbi:MAG: hypothetical protein SFU85_13510 [Candidatus Methylacidiphilales bacterium]|nr:hypothetical protein [Candidatus Methylacidiphilales bacterium]